MSSGFNPFSHSWDTVESTKNKVDPTLTQLFIGDFTNEQKVQLFRLIWDYCGCFKYGCYIMGYPTLEKVTDQDIHDLIQKGLINEFHSKLFYKLDLTQDCISSEFINAFPQVLDLVKRIRNPQQSYPIFHLSTSQKVYLLELIYNFKIDSNLNWTLLKHQKNTGFGVSVYAPELVTFDPREGFKAVTMGHVTKFQGIEMNLNFCASFLLPLYDDKDGRNVLENFIKQVEEKDPYKKYFA